VLFLVKLVKALFVPGVGLAQRLGRGAAAPLDI